MRMTVGVRFANSIDIQNRRIRVLQIGQSRWLPMFVLAIWNGLPVIGCETDLRIPHSRIAAWVEEWEDHWSEVCEQLSANEILH
jgi:hypothetical protein